jgi:precorrin-2 dehydrogenase/sirohydrochlorin ferrochelatase
MSALKNENNLFPIFLKMERLNTLIVGGGNVGLEKLEAILRNSPEASITLVGTHIKERIKEMALEYPKFTWRERAFEPADLEGINIAMLATENRETNQRIRQMAKSRNISVNVADTPDLCDFYLGSVVKKGQLKIGISTNGQSPTFAKRLRQILEEALPEETNDLLLNLRALRDNLKGDFQYKVKKLNEVTSQLVSGGKENRN